MAIVRLAAALRAPGPLQRLLASFVILASIAFFPHTAFALPQTSTPAIRVESGEVVVPCVVLYSDLTVARLLEDGDVVVGLTTHDFRLFEDGKEQKIERVTYGAVSEDHSQKWATVGKPEPAPSVAAQVNPYVITYAPPHSAEGSCHKIKVKVDRKNVEVLARGEYCNIEHPLSDPLEGTKISREMEEFAVSANPGKIPISLQVGFFHSDAKLAHLYATVEFPYGAIKYRPDPGGSRYEVAILTTVRARDGTLVARSSDITEETPFQNSSAPLDLIHAKRIPNHHEVQMELRPGVYDVTAVLSDGTKLGRAESQLTVDAYDSNQLGISSIALCKQFHSQKKPIERSSQTSPPANPDFAPLISKGLEFTPTGDTNFSTDYLEKSPLVFVYYEIYEPLLASAPTTTVQTRMRIINAKTGELETDTGQRSAADWMQGGDPVIHISQQIKANELPQGTYRIEVQASDSGGRSTSWRSATFVIK